MSRRDGMASSTSRATAPMGKRPMEPTPPARTGRAGERGFTLTELLVVLAIIGLLIAAIPVLLQSALPGTRSLAAARVLADDLRAVRGGRIASGRGASIAFDVRRQRYLVEPGDHAHKLPNAVAFVLPRNGAASI